MHLTKKPSFTKCYSRISCHEICTYELRHSLHLSLLKKWPVFLQNTSGSPTYIL